MYRMSRAAILLDIEKYLVILRDADGHETIIKEQPTVLIKVSEECTEETIDPGLRRRGRPRKKNC